MNQCERSDTFIYIFNNNDQETIHDRVCGRVEQGLDQMALLNGSHKRSLGTLMVYKCEGRCRQREKRGMVGNSTGSGRMVRVQEGYLLQRSSGKGTPCCHG
eukprot:scaffold4360_cov199-Amphora_coffeaeformis.AAC.2